MGGYSAVKYALTRDLIKGKLKELALDAIDKVNFNPELQKSNGINAMSPVKSKVQKEKRGIYNVTYNGKNSTEVRKADGDLVEYSRGNLKYGAEHIKDGHIGLDGDKKVKNGALTDSELLDLGNVIRNGELELKPKGKHQYTYYNENGERFRAIVGKNKDGETVVSYYSNRRGGSHNAQPTPTPNETIIPQKAKEPNKLMANGAHALAGGFAGGTDSIINQRDVNGDGKYNYKDLLEEVAMGAMSVATLKKLAPKLFEDGEKDGVKAGLFAGSNAKDFTKAEQEGKTFSGKYDGLDRFEIDDSKATVSPKGVGEYKLGDILHHDELYKNYPKASDIKVTFTDMPEGASGYYDPKNNEIAVNSNLSSDELKSALLHETQHAIQTNEGFAAGGSAQEFYNSAKRKLDLLKYENEFEPDEFIRDKRAKQIEALETKFENGGDEAKKQAFEDYQKLAGEIEARDVQARSNYTPEERAKVDPYSSENIDQQDANLKFNNTKQGELNMQESVDEFKKDLNNKTKTASIKGFAHVKKIIGEEATKEWGDAASTLKRWFTDTLGAEYHEVRQDDVTAINGFSVKAERLHFALKQLSEQDRNALHYYIAGDSKDIPTDLKPLGNAIKKTIDDMGQELVRHNVLSKEAYKDWKDHYIYRTYDREKTALLKNMFKRGFKIDEIFARGKTEVKTEAQMQKLMADPKFIAKTQKKLYDGGVKVTKLPNGKYEVRRDWTLQERQDMKEISDGAVSIPQTLVRMNRMLENAKMLQRVEGIDKVVLKPDDVEHFTHDEIDAMGYAKAANSPKFGVLAGKYVRKDVLDDIKSRNDEIFNTLYGADGALARLWLDYLRLWKKSKTVWNAPSHVNNFLSNFYLMHLAGMKATEIIPAVGRAGMAIANGKKIEEALQRKLIGKMTKEDKALLDNMSDETKYYLEAKENGVLGTHHLQTSHISNFIG